MRDHSSSLVYLVINVLILALIPSIRTSWLFQMSYLMCGVIKSETKLDIISVNKRWRSSNTNIGKSSHEAMKVLNTVTQGANAELKINYDCVNSSYIGKGGCWGGGRWSHAGWCT